MATRLDGRAVSKKILADLGIEGDYEGIGHCAIGYAKAPVNAPAKRKDDYVYFVR